MGLAARIIKPEPTETFRKMVHDKVDKGVDLIIDEVFKDGKEPTLSELSKVVEQDEAKVFRGMLSGVDRAKILRLTYTGIADCPKCGKRCRKR